MPEDPESKALIIGISGVSSSGKTTLARILRDIFPRSFILHEDDFYKTDAEIPVNEKGIQDWDCLESINLPAFEAALKYIRQHGQIPPDFVSKEDRNSVGEVNVDKSVIKDLEQAPMSSIRSLFDVRLLLHTDYSTAKSRREARKGYVTLEGFWEDPPGYIDDVVWPNYVKDHKFLFEDEDVEAGKLDRDVLERLGIRAMPEEAQNNMTECVKWADGIVIEALEKFTGTSAH
ncbi:uncharacterized protein MYCFIDRAFT_128992 [Pseudocercospora fijiensis CIRAD86]|uniref:Phosphoribulokinase/uridine kinase domain-containing protein n=1 Tax=Pseudocercospora fijiensis (strain CIRAD86) TaxID=383855 RepID=N1QCX2_PSEFD|nr:uncharacterized protein MYCFIDRAFT_128992 [Pseudocercospora fijiensis CIRAD86]EME89752.1 hypothetical protein MYCFIDRAFT_128992 [Pseudocercospora fijiensis CIRAD86]